MQAMVVLSCWVLGSLQGATLILVPEMMLQGELTALELALPLSLGTFVFMCFSGYWGKRIDLKVSKHQPLISVIRWALLGFLISQISFILLLDFSHLQGLSLVTALCFSRVMHGVFCSALIPTAQLTLSKNDHKGDKLVWTSIATNTGRLTAPLLTFIPLNINYFSLWFIAIITFFSLLLAWHHNETSMGYINPPTSPKSRVIEDKFTLFSNPLLIATCIAGVLISLFSSQLQFSLGPLLLARFENIQLVSEMTATLLFAASVSALISLFILYRPLSRYPKLFLTVIASSLIIGSILFMVQEYLILAVVLISSSLSMAPTWYTSLALHASHNNKGRTSAAISQGHTLGSVLGALMGGLLFVLSEQILLFSFLFLMLMILFSWGMISFQDEKLDDQVLLTKKLN